MKLINITEQPHLFFDLLPADWQETLLPEWSFYKNYAQVLVLHQGDEICAGGIIFESFSPGMEAFEVTAEEWFDKGYKYVGYVWVPERQRGKGYGSLWLKTLIQQFPKSGFWLTTEEKELRKLYEHNYFNFQQSLRTGTIEEDLFVHDPA